MAAMQDPATGRWPVTAIGPKHGGRRGPPPDHITGEGLEAETPLVDAMLKLRELDKADRPEAVWWRRARPQPAARFGSRAGGWAAQPGGEARCFSGSNGGFATRVRCTYRRSRG
jgi:hypothetical protein